MSITDSCFWISYSSTYCAICNSKLSSSCYDNRSCNINFKCLFGTDIYIITGNHNRCNMLTCSKVLNISSGYETVIVRSRNRYFINIHLIGYFSGSRGCVSAIGKPIINEELDLIRICCCPEFVISCVNILWFNTIKDNIEVHGSSVLTNSINKSARGSEGYYISSNICCYINPLITIIIHSHNGSSCRIGSSS